MKNMGVVMDDPCAICKKPLRFDYAGICMDCADEAGVSEVFEQSPDYAENVRKLVAKGIWTLVDGIG